MGGGTPGVHGALELLEGATECGRSRNGGGRDEREARANQAGVAARREQRGAKAEVGQAIPMGLRNARDESMESKASQIVRHAAGGDRGDLLS